MSKIQPLLDEYAASHQNKTNKLIHWVCVPAIFWTVVAFLWIIPFPGQLHLGPLPLNWAVISLALVMVYYLRMSVVLAIGMLLYSIINLFITAHIEQLSSFPLWQVALVVFVLAWIGQFIGHAIEGKKPSFLKDLQFLLIGPAWVISFIYKIIGIKY